MFLGWLRTLARDAILAGIEDAAVIAADGSGDAQQGAIDFRRRLTPALPTGADDEAEGVPAKAGRSKTK